MALSDFEKQRLENIERNKKLLNSLNLNSISGEIYQNIKKEEENELNNKRKRTSSPRPKKPKIEATPAVATRRSRRIAGVALDDTEKTKKFELEEDKRRREREELEKLKTIRVNGDLSLLDLIKSDDVKEEEDDNKILSKFQSFLNINGNFSIGDYYETIMQKDNSSKDVKNLREEFSSKEIYPHFKPNDIKLTKERMTYITFHPSIDKKIVIGGDTAGNCGIWDSENTENVDITSFKLHGKSICKYEFNINEPNKVYSASYDGSIRTMDLSTMKSSQFFINDGDIGISDINFNNHNEIYYTTLEGEFGRLDLRSGDHSQKTVLRLSDKKIGGFTISPNNPNHIATASLDRTLKIWDLRNVVHADWSEYDDFESAHNIGTYDSRLSVSTVDWNHSNDLVCNGYDDTVNIFNLGEDAHKWESKHIIGELNQDHRIKHNCQTGRWVSILKAKWHKLPKDKTEKVVIANMNKYFDVYDRNGIQLAHLSDPLLTVVPAVANFHQTENWIVGGGASGKVYMFS
ncbi:WD repeat-containing protein [Wickerhamomyces ciferrii]|uniref:DNA damage-binding protein CMR1 n=1 Tax=Wickerhamomyces ciferrii (strain ATCC 14091 / BCRC 22168 / CBS 111 / JCM 3599 / NBRC 0793 / NRRL Y-1031 F-60-10) TaxID=1206466 RepID=K0KS53_WICCF|nr:WD repeat-containing protein [Wickerhamomyces ciferrii]CCH44164.1 WD repeat-containing protein [Wickerhamomyces ciferrii]